MVRTSQTRQAREQKDLNTDDSQLSTSEIRGYMCRTPTMSSTNKESGYNPAYPSNTAVESGIKQFVSDFYRTSDTPGKDVEWTDFFNDDAALVMATQTARGRDGMPVIDSVINEGRG